MKKKIQFFLLMILFISGVMFYWYFHSPQIFYPALPEQNCIRGKGFLEGIFEIRANLPLNRITSVRYIIPTDEDGVPLRSASNIVFYAPFNGEAASMRKRMPLWLRDFPEKYGFSVFSLTIEANVKITNFTDQYYIYKECGWYELIFRIKAHLEKQFKLDSRKLLIVGESSGASMAQQMVAAYPSKIAAAAWTGGSRYTEFTRPLTVSMLALSNWGCYGLHVTRDLGSNAEKYGIPFLFLQTPSYLKKNGEFEHHAAAPLTYRLIHSFIADAVNKTNNTKKILAAYPYEAICQIDEDTPAAWIKFNTQNKKEKIIIYFFDKNLNHNVFYKDIWYFAAQYGYTVLAAEAHSHVNIPDHLLNKTATPVTVIGECLKEYTVIGNLFRSYGERIHNIILFDNNFDAVIAEELLHSARSFPQTQFKLFYNFPPESSSLPENIVTATFRQQDLQKLLLYEIMQK